MKIIGISPVREPRTFDNGSVVEAFFTVELRGICIHDAMLIRRPDGKYYVLPPKAMNKRGDQRIVVEIFEPGLKNKIRDAVLDAIDALESTQCDDAA